MLRAAKSSSSALSCGLPLRTAHAISPPVRTATSPCTVMLREDLLPEIRLVLVDDDERNDAGVEHLEQVFVLKRPRVLP